MGMGMGMGMGMVLGGERGLTFGGELSNIKWGRGRGLFVLVSGGVKLDRWQWDVGRMG